jgi:hypothetical protein
MIFSYPDYRYKSVDFNYYYYLVKLKAFEYSLFVIDWLIFMSSFYEMILIRHSYLSKNGWFFLHSISTCFVYLKATAWEMCRSVRVTFSNHLKLAPSTLSISKQTFIWKYWIDLLGSQPNFFWIFWRLFLRTL